MNNFIIKFQQSKCKSCGKPLKEWNSFQIDYEYMECVLSTISESLINMVKNDFKK